MFSFLYIFILLILKGIHSEIALIPQIIEQIETAVISDKGTAYLNCTMVITESQFSRAKWISVNDQKIISEGKALIMSDRIDINKNDIYEVNFLSKRSSYVPIMPGQSKQVWTYQLIIRKFIFTNSAEYRCEIDLKGFPQKETPMAIGRVILQKAPFITPISSVIINEFEELRIECKGQGSPSPNISWTRSNGEAFPLPGSPQRIRNNTLIIPKVGRYDRGMYRCYAQNNVGKAAEYDVMVEVTIAPTVRPARRGGAYAQMPNQNYRIMIECIVNGYPDPDLYWYKGVYDPNKSNVLIQNDVRYASEKIVSYGAVGTNITDVFFVLRILNVVESDFGEYTCLARNKMGYNQTIITIFKQQVCQGALCSILPGKPSSAPDSCDISKILLMVLVMFGYLKIYIYH